MAAGFPVKANYVAGDVLTAADMNDLSATLNYLDPTAKGDLFPASSGTALTRLAVGANDTVLTADSSTATGLKWAAAASGSTFAGVSLWKSANQSFSSGAGVNATFDTELFDTDGYHSTSTNTDRITIPSGKAGYYLITGRATWNYSSTGQRIGAIRKNAGATQLAQETQINMTSSFFTSLTVQIIANLAVGDYVVFENYQDGTGSLDLLGGTQIWTTFSAAYLGA
jgi:hypothetical protein